MTLNQRLDATFCPKIWAAFLFLFLLRLIGNIFSLTKSLTVASLF